jgi:YD repeat-containing protein
LLRPNSKNQSYGNCGPEACRQIINKATGKNISQEDLLKKAQQTPSTAPGRKHQADGTMDPKHIGDSGASTPEDDVGILNDNGVPAHLVKDQNPDTDGLAQAVAEGKGTLVVVNTGRYRRLKKDTGDTHVIAVTGVTYDGNGKIVEVTVNDTGIESGCGQVIPQDHLYHSRDGHYPSHIETDNQVF